jgi:hypothetical protein
MRGALPGTPPEERDQVNKYDSWLLLRGAKVRGERVREERVRGLRVKVERGAL